MLESIKHVYRFLKYPNERKRFWREICIRRSQVRLLKEKYDSNTRSLIVFVVPGADPATGEDLITGGTISIISLCEETDKLFEVHGANTIACVLRGDSLFLKHRKFENSTVIFRFEQLAAYFLGLQSITIHLPEFMAYNFANTLTERSRTWLKHLDKIHLNILNQNIKLMPSSEVISSLGNVFDLVTITTAHQKYCTQHYRNLYNVPLHKFSVWISPEQYHFVKWTEKENLMVISPDQHPQKEAIMEMLYQVEGLKIEVIQNLTYAAYKELISRAKWSITFGEGLDGYFIEPVFSGAVSFAVFNQHFFTSDFKELPTIFNSMDELKSRILSLLNELDDAKIFETVQNLEYQICSKYYSREVYMNNVRDFYKGNYTFP